MSLQIWNQHLMRSSREELPALGELVVGYQNIKPIFAMLLEVNGENYWHEVSFPETPNGPIVQYRIIEGDEACISEWASIPSVVEV